MSEMIERVAEIIHKYPYFTGEECKAIAKAAIAAMREPTDDMVAAGAVFHIRERDLNGYNKSKNDAKVSWQAMIDEALE